jgi:hypothetical protein
VHLGQTPAEMFNDEFADTEKQTQQIQLANQKRLIENRKYNCNFCKSL